MAHHNQIEFIKANQDLIKEPILVVGSKMYDFDKYDISKELELLGYSNITGIDIDDGPGVDYQVDITDQLSGFVVKNKHRYATVVCMEVLTNVRNPFVAAQNVANLLINGGTVILSECFVRKLSRMPIDYWRFSYDGLKALFVGFKFFDDRAKFSITRQKDGLLENLRWNFEELLAGQKHNQESLVGYYLRKLHRKYFSKGIFKISRWLPEQTVYAVGRKDV